VASKPGKIPEHFFALWNSVADFPTGETDAALTHLMKTLAEWIRADNVMWAGRVRMRTGATAQRDSLQGWRALVIESLRSSSAITRRSQLAIRQQDTAPAMTAIALTANAGSFRVHRIRDGFLDFAHFRRTSYYDTHYRQAGLHDRMWVVVPVNADVESCFVFDLHEARRRFTAADADMVGQCLRGMKWFHRNLMLSHGLFVADKPFTPAQRRVLALLLTECSEAEIAKRLNLSRGTVHQYAVQLCRMNGVKGRTGLLSLWLG
jgi:DNA-binding CsgD family transcriptional regulator